jgi:hypothetical protein
MGGSPLTGGVELILKSFSAHEVFEGRLLYDSPERFTEGYRLNLWCASISWTMYKFGRNNVRLMVEVDKEATVAALGVLLAVCMENPAEISAPSRSPLTIDLVIRGLQHGAVGVREVEVLLAPVRPLAESMTLYRHLDQIGRGRRRQTHPLGVLLVRLP